MQQCRDRARLYFNLSIKVVSTVGSSWLQLATGCSLTKLCIQVAMCIYSTNATLPSCMYLDCCGVERERERALSSYILRIQGMSMHSMVRGGPILTSGLRVLSHPAGHGCQFLAPVLVARTVFHYFHLNRRHRCSVVVRQRRNLKRLGCRCRSVMNRHATSKKASNSWKRVEGNRLIREFAHQVVGPGLPVEAPQHH
eukprot:1475383-Amphidinium_carterae.2